MTNSFHLQHCFYLWITCYTCILYLDDCQTTTVLCHEGVLQRNQTCHDKKHEIALHGAAHKNHLNWQSNLSLLNTFATKTIHFNEITPLPLSEITISKFMSIWEYQSQWCVIEIMTFPVKKGRKSCKLWLEMTQELSLHMKIFAEGESPGKGGWFIQQGSN